MSRLYRDYQKFVSCRHTVDSVYSSLILLALRGIIESDSRQQTAYKNSANHWLYWLCAVFVLVTTNSPLYNFGVQLNIFLCIHR